MLISCHISIIVPWYECSVQSKGIISSIKLIVELFVQSSIMFSCKSDELLKLAKSETIHSKNLKLLVIEVFKSIHCLNPQIMWDAFPLKANHYHSRQGKTDKKYSIIFSH